MPDVSVVSWPLHHKQPCNIDTFLLGDQQPQPGSLQLASCPVNISRGASVHDF